MPLKVMTLNLLECELETGAEPLTVFAAHFDSHHESLRFVEALPALPDRPRSLR